MIATTFPIIVRSAVIFPTKLSLSCKTKLAKTDVATTPNEPSEATNVAGIMTYAKKLASSPEKKNLVGDPWFEANKECMLMSRPRKCITVLENGL